MEKKKLGFTLQEVLIAMVIIGVIAAVTVPGIVGLMPCRNKIEFLNVNKTIRTIVADLADDSAAYHPSNENDSCVFLNCTNGVEELGITIETEPYKKLGMLAKQRLSLSEDNCGSSDSGCMFETKNAVTWTFTTPENSSGNDILLFVDVNNSGGRDDTNKSFRNVESLQRDSRYTGIFDQFRFIISEDGGITVDQFGQALLNDPTNLKTKDVKAIVKGYYSNQKKRS